MKLPSSECRNSSLIISQHCFSNKPYGVTGPQWINILRPRQNGRHYADDMFKCIFLNENVWISIKISLKFVPKGPINNIPLLVQIMAWRRSGDKPLSESMVIRLPTHICVTRPQWVNSLWTSDAIWLHRSESTLDQIMIYPGGSKPSPEPILTHHQWGPMTIVWGQFYKRYLSDKFLKLT